MQKFIPYIIGLTTLAAGAGLYIMYPEKTGDLPNLDKQPTPKNNGSPIPKPSSLPLPAQSAATVKPEAIDQNTKLISNAGVIDIFPRYYGEIWWLQRYLNSKGYKLGTSGKFDTKTRKAMLDAMDMKDPGGKWEITLRTFFEQVPSSDLEMLSISAQDFDNFINGRKPPQTAIYDEVPNYNDGEIVAGFMGLDAWGLY